MQPAQRTPSKTGQEIDRHIAYLNATWDLRLPRLHGKEAQDAEESDEYARKCSARIRALCWCGQVNVDSVIADFEERAQTLKSEWICKSLFQALYHTVCDIMRLFGQEADEYGTRQTTTRERNTAVLAADQIIHGSKRFPKVKGSIE